MKLSNPEPIHHESSARGNIAAAALPVRRAWEGIRSHIAPTEPLTLGPRGRRGLYVVLLGVVAYTAALTTFCIGLQDTFRTHAEELGIMDQVLWNTVHGHFMQESLCNAVWGGNCLGSVSRFAIHFEPILIPLSLIYVVAPNVKILLFLQAAGVAVGAIPAYLLATWRLKHLGWGLLFAALYLVYPPLLSAVIHDFHPETAAAGLLMWALYFLFARRGRALVLTCVVLLACKETFTLDVAMIGLFAIAWQRRVRLGTGLVVLAAGTLVLALLLMRLNSPLGHSPVTDRFLPLLQHPFQTILGDVTDPARLSYLLKLLGPLGFLPLLAPWTAVMALPSVALNFFSDFSSMYSGSNQYNVDIGPVLVFSAIDAMVWVAPAVAKMLQRTRQRNASAWRAPGAARWLRPQVLVVALLLVGLGVEGPSLSKHVGGYLGNWPAATAHTRLGYQILALIPPDASVSAQSTLVPHLSHRTQIEEFPSGENVEEYVVVDTDSDYYPFYTRGDFDDAVQSLVKSPQLQVVADRDGYVLLRRVRGT
jgi:uncharacterized membrane protein